MMKLRINPLVAVDLKEIKDFIAEDNEDKALLISIMTIMGILEGFMKIFIRWQKLLIN